MTNLRAIGLVLTAMLWFAVQDVIVKVVADQVSLWQMQVIRSVSIILMICALLTFLGRPSEITPARWRWPFVRALFMCAAYLGFYASLPYISLAKAASAFFISPMLITVLAAIFLGMAGVLIVLAPRLSIESLDGASKLETIGAMAALIAAVFAALAQVFVRKLVQVENTASIVFWFSVTCTVLSLLTIPFGWVMPTPMEAALLVGAGLLGGLGQILLTESYRHAETAVIAPFEYASMLFAIAIGYAVFGEVPTFVMLLGASIVIASGVLIILREHYLKIQRGKGRQHVTKYG